MGTLVSRGLATEALGKLLTVVDGRRGRNERNATTIHAKYIAHNCQRSEERRSARRSGRQDLFQFPRHASFPVSRNNQLLFLELLGELVRARTGDDEPRAGDNSRGSEEDRGVSYCLNRG